MCSTVRFHEKEKETLVVHENVIYFPLQRLGDRRLRGRPPRQGQEVGAHPEPRVRAVGRVRRPGAQEEEEEEGAGGGQPGGGAGRRGGHAQEGGEGAQAVRGATRRHSHAASGARKVGAGGVT